MIVKQQAPLTLTVAGLGIPLTKAELDAEYASDKTTLAELLVHPDIADDHELVVLDATLSDVARLHDELVARRQAPVKQVKGLITEFESWFRPYLKDVVGALDALKAVKSRYLTAKDAAARQAREDAQKAADAGDSAAVLASVQLSQELAAAPAGTRYAWEATVINENMLPDDYWTIDHAKLATVAKGMGNAEEQTVFVPGVKFERVAVVQARRVK